MSRLRSRKSRPTGEIVPWDDMHICAECGCVVADQLTKEHDRIVHRRPGFAPAIFKKEPEPSPMVDGIASGGWKCARCGCFTPYGNVHHCPTSIVGGIR